MLLHGMFSILYLLFDLVRCALSCAVNLLNSVHTLWFHKGTGGLTNRDVCYCYLHFLLASVMCRIWSTSTDNRTRSFGITSTVLQHLWRRSRGDCAGRREGNLDASCHSTAITYTCSLVLPCFHLLGAQVLSACKAISMPVQR